MNKFTLFIMMLYASLCPLSVYAQEAARQTMSIEEMFSLADQNSKSLRPCATGISGDNKSTRLLINGQVVEEMNTQKLYYNAGKDSMNYVRTLVFPLEKAGKFDSKITNLKVYKK